MDEDPRPLLLQCNDSSSPAAFHSLVVMAWSLIPSAPVAVTKSPRVWVLATRPLSPRLRKWGFSGFFGVFVSSLFAEMKLKQLESCLGDVLQFSEPKVIDRSPAIFHFILSNFPFRLVSLRFAAFLCVFVVGASFVAGFFVRLWEALQSGESDGAEGGQVELEQYPTGPHIASRMLFMVQSNFLFFLFLIGDFLSPSGM